MRKLEVEAEAMSEPRISDETLRQQLSTYGKDRTITRDVIEDLLDSRARCSALEMASREITCVWCGHQFVTTLQSQADELYAHAKACEKHPIRKAEAERDRLLQHNAALHRALMSLIKGIDNWNAAVQQIIGRQADYKWGDLENARQVLRDTESAAREHDERIKAEARRERDEEYRQAFRIEYGDGSTMDPERAMHMLDAIVESAQSARREAFAECEKIARDHGRKILGKPGQIFSAEWIADAIRAEAGKPEGET